MEPLILILTICTLTAVLAVLGLGIFSMMKGGAFNKKHSNNLMKLRVGLQALCLVLLATMWFFST
ncbi:MAG: twin transmembrane helix small protein [Alphaproteobacteria bacterium]|nr:twin transmembrane helix small protein [Alphaproteobacteria bacterium]MCB1551560.1 twin transmembrane helix small protein [Alphaproteobacteria bacterium]MCB9984750.1 twin transmembrane helix small protein [Micavibrio sp.]HPQ50141.1 twin transmembrane helix small protein [Alphaproteobacteria bacterium]HRK98506.1 twin transmembrane helix small protein [Alphaproteobacteria bacterium]